MQLESDMKVSDTNPTAAGKSSFDLIDVGPHNYLSLHKINS